MNCALQIKHINTSQDNKLFVVVHNGEQSQPIALTSPWETIAEKHNTNLQQDLKWYIEEYLELPIEAACTRADDVQTALSQWGRDCFDKLFGNSPALDWYYKAQQEEKLANLQFIIISNDPAVLTWPWEALKNPDNKFIAQHYHITRQIETDKIKNTQPLSDTLPYDKLNILYIIARPTDLEYVEYQTLYRPIIKFITKEGWPVHIDVLRPPTFEKLQQILEEKPNFYHVIHFDGHGNYSAASGGLLAFERDSSDCIEQSDYSSDYIKATKLGKLLRKHNIPLVVLNACKSAMQDKNAKDLFASVATNLLLEGISSVVAMSYSLWISGAKVFVPAFYQQLFKEGNINTAMLVARKAMYNNKMRDTFTSQVELYDWIVPVLYQQTLVNSLPKLRSTTKQENNLPVEEQFLGDYDFIGRDRAIQQLERAIRLKPAGILIHGMVGEGKTTLTTGFLQWLKATNGLPTDVFWFNFQNIHSAEDIINPLFDSLVGTQESVLSSEQKMSRVTQILKKELFFIVWDNFELASGIPNTDVSALLPEADRNLLKQLLHDLHGSATKVLIVSRSPENWLTPQECQKLQLSGLSGQELWQYCNTVVKDVGLSFDRENETYKQLMNKLNGNPLAIRAILLRLQEKSATEILRELDNNFNGLTGDDATRRIQAALSVFEKGLNRDFAPILRLLGLHEHCVDTFCLEHILETAENFNAPIDECFVTLENAGLCHAIGNNRYQIHPALRSCLTRTHPAQKTDKQAFVTVISKLSNVFSIQEIATQLQVFTLFGANFYGALKLAQEIDQQELVLILTENLARYALNIRNFTEATKLYNQCFEAAKKTNDTPTIASVYHQLGWIAEEQRDFTAATEWYTKSLHVSQGLGDEYGVAQTYHNLGVVAWAQRDFTTAIKQYTESLQIKNKLNDEQGIAQTYHNLGVIAYEQRDLPTAIDWYSKAIEINKKLGAKYGESQTYHNLAQTYHNLAQTYHNLGCIALAQRDFTAVEEWYNKAIEIKEKLGDAYSLAQTYQQLGLFSQEQRDFTSATKWYTKVLQISKKLGDEQGEANAFHQLGRVAQEQRDFTTAKEWYNKSLQISQTLGDELGVAQTYHNLGLVAYEQRDLITAKEQYNKSLNIKQKIGDEYGLARTYHNLGMIAQEQRDFATAKDWYNKALQIEHKLGDEQGEAQTYHNLGMITQEQRDIAVATGLYNKSLVIKLKLGDEQGKAQTYQQLGLVASEQRDFTTAKEQFNKAIRFSQIAGDEYGAAQIYHQLGLIAQEQRDFTTAKEWYNKSLQINQMLGDEHGAAQTYHNLGIIAQVQSDFSTAKKMYDKALTIYRKLDDAPGVAQTCHNLGAIAREQQEFIVAEEWYKKSLQISQKLDDEQGVSITYHGLGNVAFEQRKFDTANEWYKKSLQISQKLDDEQGVAQTYHNLGRVAQEQQNFDTANEWYSKSLQINQKLGDEYGTALTYQQLGRTARDRRDFTVAIAWYNKALQINQKLDDTFGVAQSYHNLGLIAYEQGDFTVAETWYNKSLHLFEQIGDQYNSDIVKQSLTKLKKC